MISGSFNASIAISKALHVSTENDGAQGYGSSIPSIRLIASLFSIGSPFRTVRFRERHPCQDFVMLRKAQRPLAVNRVRNAKPRAISVIIRNADKHTI